MPEDIIAESLCLSWSGEGFYSQALHPLLPDKILFGIINGIADFQRLRDKLIDYEELENTFYYLDNITVADNAEHDKHAKFFKDAATASWCLIIPNL